MKRTRVVLGALAVISAGCDLSVPSTISDGSTPIDDRPDAVVADALDVVDAPDVFDAPDVRDVVDVPDVLDAPDARDVVDVAEAPCGNAGQTCCMASTCATGLTCQAGTCVDLRCPGSGETRCGGACVNTASDPTHCGTCDVVCSVTNGTPSCTGGVCGIASCATGFGDCDRNAANGCETSTETRTNCGACGVVCGDQNTMSSRCESSACALVCQSGFRDCDAMPGTGCEVNTATDTANCGACGMRCSAGAHSTATCALGACGITCEAGFADCNGNAADGCEVNTQTDAANCGSCGRACAAGGTCSAGNCGAPRSCNDVHTMMPTAPSGVYLIDPAGDGLSVQVYCDMTYMGGGWTLAFLRNSVDRNNYPQFLHNNFQVAQISRSPESAATATTSVAGWLNLNAGIPYTSFFMSAYVTGVATPDRSAVIPRASLRIPFGTDGYYLYNASGYYWCGGRSAFVDNGVGENMPVMGAPYNNCKNARMGGGATGDGWDFSMANTPRAGFTMCGLGPAGCDNLTANGAFRVAPFRYYGTAGVAQAIWVR